MALGKRKREQQDTFWVTADKLGNGPRNAFYDRLNQLLAEVDFDGKLEKAVEPHRSSKRKRKNKPESTDASYRRNRRNTLDKRGRRLRRKRSERVERTFAHLCDTDGLRRAGLRGIEDVQKRFMSAATAYNLGRVMQSIIT